MVQGKQSSNKTTSMFKEGDEEFANIISFLIICLLKKSNTGKKCRHKKISKVPI
jgi:hypothetical protein